MLELGIIAVLAVYAAICEVCAHNPKMKANSVLQVIRGLLAKVVEQTGAKQKLADELKKAEDAASAPEQK